MSALEELFVSNRKWADQRRREDPEFFSRLVRQQTPKILWIGCADSRVPANEIVGLPPGAMFVHRNVANQVIHSDFNCLSVIEYAVAYLHVEHVIVCGHYGCGGVKAALEDHQLGLIDNWLRHLREVREKHLVEVDAVSDSVARIDRLCELNVIEQVNNVCQTTIVQNAWHSGRPVAVHGWIYRIDDGLLHDLHTTIASADGVASAYRIAIRTALA